MMADNVLPAVLRAKGVLVLTDAAAAEVEQGGDSFLPAGSGLEVELRALSVEACERVVQSVNAKLKGAGGEQQGLLTAALLDLWIWGVMGKEDSMRDAPRHYTKDTAFY